ncbi:fimbrial protein [Stenotrophomonas forensis]|uniref:fimbrial protein n=1 Tax=Stenotrophomonas forensis TaxID=2871169 RepID=UPI0039C5D15D
MAASVQSTRLLIPRPGARAVVGPMVLCLLMFLGASARAASCTAGTGSAVFAAPASIQFSTKGVANGAALTPWISVNASSGGVVADFRCSTSVEVSYRGISHGGFLPERYVESGASYMVYPTGVQGVGVVFNMESPKAPRGRPFALIFDEVELFAGQSGTAMGMRILVKFIRTGNIPNGSHTTKMVMSIQSRLYEAGNPEPLRVDMHLMGSTLKIADPPSCRMRTQEVNMGTLSPASFSGVGSHAGRRSYDLALDCEAGVGQVDYQVVPTTAVINSELGLAEASGGVGGVAYQFLNADGSPLRFYTTDLFGHGGASEQVLTKTFGVRYQQTLPTITPGPANAGLMFSLTFP